MYYLLDFTRKFRKIAEKATFYFFTRKLITILKKKGMAFNEFLMRIWKKSGLGLKKLLKKIKKN